MLIVERERGGGRKRVCKCFSRQTKQALTTSMCGLSPTDSTPTLAFLHNKTSRHARRTTFARYFGIFWIRGTKAQEIIQPTSALRKKRRFHTAMLPFSIRCNKHFVKPKSTKRANALTRWPSIIWRSKPTTKGCIYSLCRRPPFHGIIALQSGWGCRIAATVTTHRKQKRNTHIFDVTSPRKKKCKCNATCFFSAAYLIYRLSSDRTDKGKNEYWLSGVEVSPFEGLLMLWTRFLVLTKGAAQQLNVWEGE